MTPPLKASLTLHGPERPAIGRERILLLEAVARSGSIAGGAKAVGLSYKAAWDALDALSNLFGQPLLETRSGGRCGGGARLTEAGRRVIRSYHRLEAELTRLLGQLEPDLAGTGIRPFDLFTGFLMRTSARNVLRGTIAEIRPDTLTAEIAVEVGPETTVYAQVTEESVREMGLVPGRDVVVLIKAPFVMIAPGKERPTVSARNCLGGSVVRCEVSAVNAEVVLDIGSDKRLTATITAQSARALELAPGTSAFALFDAAHVIVATD